MSQPNSSDTHLSEPSTSGQDSPIPADAAELTPMHKLLRDMARDSIDESSLSHQFEDEAYFRR